MFNLLPNELWDYGPADAIRGIRTALSNRQSDTRREILIPGLGSCLPIRSARAAIAVALRALALPPLAAVGVPLYCCPVVFKAIKAAGFQPRFIDIDPDTYCISATDVAAKSAELDVVIAVHMFGNVCDMPALREAAPGKPLIEDCAQALGSQLNGRLTGSFGEVGVFSFRSGKYLSVGEGGAIYCASADLKSKLSNLINELPVPVRSEEFIHVAKTYLRSLLRTKPMWGIIGSSLWDTYSKGMRYEAQSPLALGQIFETDRQMADWRLPVLDSWIDKQRSNADYFARNIIVESSMLCRETAGAFFNRFQYPILAQSPRQCEQLVAFLRQKQISTARPYKDIATIASTHYGYIGDCPQAERVASSVLVIPCNHSLKAGDLERVASAVNRAWSEVRDRQGGSRIPSLPASDDTVDVPASQQKA